MKKNIFLLLMPFLFFVAGDIRAEEWCAEDPGCYEDNCCEDVADFYAKFFGGANFLQNTKITNNKTTYQTGYIVAGSLGYCWRNGLRMEAEYAYRRNTINQIHLYGQGSCKDGHFQTSSYMANILWDMPLCSWGCDSWNIQPYIGAGIGYDYQQMHSSTSRIVFNQKWNDFSWQLMAGLSYPFICNTVIALEYKFHQGGSHFYNHSVGVGLTYRFNFLK